MFATLVCALALAPVQRARSTFEFTVDPATTQLVLQSNVQQELLNCSHQLIPGGSSDLGPLQECPSGSSLIPFNPTGTVKLALVRNGVGGLQASFAGGNLEVASLSGFVGDCAAPDASFVIDSFAFTLVSSLFSVSPPGTPVAGCSPGDNYQTDLRMLVSTGQATFTVPSQAPSTIAFDCSNSNFAMVCGSLTRQGNDVVLVANFGAANPILIPWSYEVDVFHLCPPPLVSPFRYVRFSGNLSFTGTLGARLTRVRAQPPGNPRPGCP